MRVYPELIQSLLIHCSNLMTDDGDVYQGTCWLTQYIFQEYHQSVCLPPNPPEEIQRETEFEISFPYGQASFPGVILFHGSSPAFSNSMMHRRRFYLDRGYAVMIANSFTQARISDHCSDPLQLQHNLTALTDQCPVPPFTTTCRDHYFQSVTSGHLLTPAERAHDFFEAVRVMKGHPDIDPDRLSVVGYSHGGSVVLEALTLAKKGTPPPGGAQLPDNPIAGINAAILYYPNCRPGGYFEHHRTLPEIPILMILAEQDKVVSPEICQEVADDINQQVLHKKIHIRYFDGTHAFDMTEYPGFNSEFRHQAELMTAAFIHKYLNQCSIPEAENPSLMHTIGIHYHDFLLSNEFFW